jgi:hypothetical protein
MSPELKLTVYEKDRSLICLVNHHPCPTSTPKNVPALLRKLESLLYIFCFPLSWTVISMKLRKLLTRQCLTVIEGAGGPQTT